MSKTTCEERDMIIRKSNMLIQKSRFSLTVNQQRVVLYMISKLMPCDSEFKEYEFDLSDFCRSCDISLGSGRDYADLKSAIQNIRDKSMWITQTDGSQTLVSWINKAKITPNTGKIIIRLDDDMKPFLLELKKNYTEYELSTVMRFRSKYSIRLYEYIKSIHYYELQEYETELSLSEIKERLGAENYTEWDKFKARALEPAIKEINEYSDKILKYSTRKTGKKVEYVTLYLRSKDTVHRITDAAKPKQRNKKETD